LVKTNDPDGRSPADRDFAIRQIGNRAVASTEIVDILAAAGITTPDPPHSQPAAERPDRKDIL
jgi:type I restriction enzyme, R subunit